MDLTISISVLFIKRPDPVFVFRQDPSFSPGHSLKDKKSERKGREQLSHRYNERLIFRTEMNSFDCTLVFNRVFDFDHEICRDDFHVMIRVHVLDDLFCNLTFVHTGSLE
jgi:hypothetical protein